MAKLHVINLKQVVLNGLGGNLNNVQTCTKK